MAGRIRVNGSARPVSDAGEELAYTGPRTIVRAIVNAVSCSEDPFELPTEDLTALIRKLQEQDATLAELREAYANAGMKHAWSEVDGL